MSSDPVPSSPAERLLRAETSPEETRSLVARALAVAEPPEPWTPPEVDPAAYEDAFEHLAARAASWEESAADAQQRADERVAALLALSTEDLKAHADDEVENPTLHTWEAAEALREASLDAGIDDPARAVVLAEAAESAARGVAETDAVPGAEGADLVALAVGQRANALRVASDLRAADALLHQAVTTARSGTGDLLVRARLWSLAASLRSDQSRFDEALTLTRRAATAYHRLGDDRCRGRLLLKQATLHAYRDDLDTALRVLEDARRLLAADAGAIDAVEPRLRFALHQNRASILERLGRLDEARADHARAEEALEDRDLDRLRWAWLGARLEARDDDEAAEATFRRVRDGFLERGLAYEAAQVSLELAVLLARSGRTAAMKELAEEVTPLFAARDLHGEARTALEIYREAVRTEAVGLELLEGLVARLRRARRWPDPA